LKRENLKEILKNKNATIASIALQYKIGKTTINDALNGKYKTVQGVKNVLEEIFEMPLEKIQDAWQNKIFLEEEKKEKKIII